MAVIKRISGQGSTKVILDYVMNKEKTEDKIISGINCSSDTAYEEMELTKKMFYKREGVQYHHIIQSFKPFEVSPEIAHQIGVELAEKSFENFECVIVTHIDKEHIHNHIVINSVDKYKGKKYNATNTSLWDIKRESNRLCERENLSTIDFEKKAKERLTSAELRIQLRGGECWKEDLRQVINTTKTEVTSLTEMQTVLKEKYNVEMKIQNKNLSFLHPDKQKYCRGIKLGYAYTKEFLESGFDRGQELSDGFGAIDTSNQFRSRTIDCNRDKIQPNYSGKNFDVGNYRNNKSSGNTGFNYVGKATDKVKKRYKNKYKKGMQLKYVSLIKLIVNLIVTESKPARKYNPQKPYNKENDYDVNKLTTQLLFINKENIKNENELLAKYNEADKSLNQTKIAIKKTANLSKNLKNVISKSEVYYKLKEKGSLTSSEKIELESVLLVVQKYKVKGEDDLDKLRIAYKKTNEKIKTLKIDCEPIETRLAKIKEVIDTYESIENDSYLKIIQLPNRQSRGHEI